MSKADYRKVVPFVLRWEGGEVNDKDDSGGHTNKGITWTTYKGLSAKLLGKAPTKANFVKMTREDAYKFIEHYWNKATWNNSIKSQAVAEAIFTWYWGSGANGIKQWQRMLRDHFGKKSIGVDGGVGRETITFTNSIDEKKLMPVAIRYREQTFRRIANGTKNAKFLKGWLNRLDDFTKRHASVLETTAKVGGGAGLILGGLGLFF